MFSPLFLYLRKVVLFHIYNYNCGRFRDETERPGKTTQTQNNIMKNKYLGTALAVSALLFIRSGGEAIAQATDCGVKTIPYVEHFDDDSWASSTVLNCWTIVNENNDDKTWKQGSPGADGSAYCVQYAYSGSNAAQDWLISPQINLDRAVSLSFKVRSASASFPEKYSVWVSENTSDIADFVEVKGATPVNHTDWKDVEVDLSAYAGKMVYIAIKAVSDADMSSLYVDEVALITCAAPSGFEVLEATAHSARIAINTTAPSLEYACKLSEAENWGESISIASNQISLTELSAGKTYQLRVKAHCGEGDESDWSSSFEFRTECDVFPLPYMENFEEGSWPTAKELNCWTILDANADGTTWQRNTYEGVGGSYSAVSSNSYSNAAEDWLITPQLDLTGAATCSFSIKSTSSSYASVYSVWISEKGVDPDDFVALQEETDLISTDYATLSFDLTAWQGKKVYIAVKNTSKGGSYGGGVSIDNFMVVTCPTPADVRLVELNENSVKVACTASGALVPEYRESGSEEWVVAPAQNSNPFEITGLSEGKTYSLRLKAVCSADDESFYSEEISFTLPCYAFEFPLLSEFTGTVPLCWNGETYKGKAWQAGTDGNGRGYVNYSGSNQQWGYLMTPDVDVSAASKERLQIELTYAVGNYYGGQFFYLDYSTDRGLTWDTLPNVFSATSITTVEIPLGEKLDGATMLRVRLRGIGSSNLMGNGIAVYDFKIQNSPICFPPVQLKTEGDILYNETRLAWEKPATESMDGDIRKYEITYFEKEDAGTLWNAEAVAPDTTVLLTGLRQHTGYTASVLTVCQTEKSVPVKISWETPYSCVKVEDLHLVGLQADNVSLFWKSGNDLFDLYYKRVEDEAWTMKEGIPFEGTYVLSGLNPSTEYVVKVRSVCSQDDRSLWDSIRFVTANKALPLPYTEGFEGDVLPAYWEYTWLSGSTSYTHWSVEPAEHKEGNKSLRFYAYMLNNSSSIMASPLLDFSLDAVYTLEFWMYRHPSCNKENEGLKIFVSEFNKDTAGADLIAYIHNNINREPAVDAPSDDNWYHYSIDLKGISGYRYILLCGISEYSQNFFIDDFKVNALYETNLGLTGITPVLPRANLGTETLRVEMENTGLDELSAVAEICFRVDNGEVVKESIDFTDEPLAPETPFSYTFTQKADFSQVGQHTLTVWVSVPGEPAFDDTLRMEVLHYAPVELPYGTRFDKTEESDSLIRIFDLNADGTTWQPVEDKGMFLAPNADQASDDALYTPGFDMPAGIYEVEVVYGAADETLTEKMRLSRVQDFESAGKVLLERENIKEAAQTATVLDTLGEAGIWMLCVKGESPAGQGGLYLNAVRFNRLQTWAKADVAICEGDVHLFGDRELTEAGIYVDTVFREGNVVDSIVTLTLTVNPVYSFNVEGNICEGEAYELGGNAYTETGEYTLSLSSRSGCDSVYHLSLTVNPKPGTPVVTARQEDDRQWLLTAQTDADRVQWYNLQGAIDGADDFTYTATEEGVYHATALNECGESAASNTIEVLFTGVEGDVDAVAPLMYPNPARDQLRISSPEPMQTLAVYTQSGRLVSERRNLNVTEITLPLVDMSAGVYMVQIRTKAGVYGYKLIVNK